MLENFNNIQSSKLCSKSLSFIYIIILCVGLFLFTTTNQQLLASDYNSKIGFSYLHLFDFLNLSNSSISNITTCCPKELNGSGNSNIISANYGVKIGDNAFFSGLVAYSSRNSSFSTIENITLNLDSTAINGAFSHNLNINYQSIIIGIDYSQDIIGTYGIGFAFLYEMPFGAELNYNETLLSPKDRGYFPDSGSRIRNQIKGDYTSLRNNIFHLNIYLGKELPLESGFSLVVFPKIGFNYTLGGLDKSVDFSAYSIFIGISINKKI